jgi:hypothetical protein
MAEMAELVRKLSQTQKERILHRLGQDANPDALKHISHEYEGLVDAIKEVARSSNEVLLQDIKEEVGNDVTFFFPDEMELQPVDCRMFSIPEKGQILYLRTYGFKNDPKRNYPQDNRKWVVEDVYFSITAPGSDAEALHMLSSYRVEVMLRQYKEEKDNK